VGAHRVEPEPPRRIRSLSAGFSGALCRARSRRSFHGRVQARAFHFAILDVCLRPTFSILAGIAAVATLAAAMWTARRPRGAATLAGLNALPAYLVVGEKFAESWSLYAAQRDRLVTRGNPVDGSF
jgi:hypothetical protein